MKVKRATTNIKCNKCEYFETFNRKINISKASYKNIIIAICKERPMIGTYAVMNSDINNDKIPIIQAPFQCPKRQKLRMQDKEYKFEMSIL